MINDILIQALSYFIVLVLAIVLISVLLRGFFWNYLKVRTSFGKLVMIKARNPLRDYFTRGEVKEGFIEFKYNNQLKRLRIEPGIFYRCLMVNWLDYDEETNALTKADYSTVPGFDAIKFSDLLTRALMRPVVKSQFETIVIGLLIGLILLGLATAYLSFMAYDNTQKIKLVTDSLPEIIQGIKGNVVGSTGL